MELNEKLQNAEADYKVALEKYNREICSPDATKQSVINRASNVISAANAYISLLKK